MDPNLDSRWEVFLFGTPLMLYFPIFPQTFWPILFLLLEILFPSCLPPNNPNLLHLLKSHSAFGGWLNPCRNSAIAHPAPGLAARLAFSLLSAPSTPQTRLESRPHLQLGVVVSWEFLVFFPSPPPVLRRRIKVEFYGLG